MSTSIDQANIDALLTFLAQSPSPYHASAQLAERFTAAGYTEVQEGDDWSSAATGRLCLRQGGTFLAYRAGTEAPEQSGLRLLGAHTDSPNLRLKPQPLSPKQGFLQLGVEVYGSPLWHSWLDRPLSVAGRLVRMSETGPKATLLRLTDAVCCIPDLAVHLNRKVNREGLRLNPQDHLQAIGGLAAHSCSDLAAWLQERLPASDAARAHVDGPMGFDLCLFDTTAPSLIEGLHCWVQSARLDNLLSCFAAAEAMLHSPETSAGQVLICYDHEEVGSRSALGAASDLLGRVLRRLLSPSGHDPARWARTLARSLFVSIDMAHALHPHYADRHEAGHQPMLGAGPVLKRNAAQSYATDAVTAALVAHVAAERNLPLQHFVTRSDLPCGGTVGPIVASRLGIASVDLGNPMLAMHSCRELADTADLAPLVQLLKGLLQLEQVHVL
ncbi:MAG: M18 family aminopeptidase [Polyangiales bacterium]